VSHFATDVAIIGGGVAGTAAALTLRRYGQCHCTLLEASDYGTARVGDTVSPALAPLLEYLGAASSMATTLSVVSHGSEATWGSDNVSHRASLFSAEGSGWNIDRRRFDAEQAAAAARAGARVWRCAALRHVGREGGCWRLQFHHEGSMHSLTALQLIDASGGRAALGRKLGARRLVIDRLVGLSVYVSGMGTQTAPQTILIEAAPDGWWYSAPLPDERAVITFISDADLVRGEGGSLSKVFARKFSQTHYVSGRFGELPVLSPIHVNCAQSQTLSPCVDAGWVAAGDAAASFDPLSWRRLMPEISRATMLPTRHAGGRYTTRSGGGRTSCFGSVVKWALVERDPSMTLCARST
jgi:flavin-dependent dehydrogenase